MRIAFIADSLPSFKIHKDSTYAMMVEAARRGRIGLLRIIAAGIFTNCRDEVVL